MNGYILSIQVEPGLRLVVSFASEDNPASIRDALQQREFYTKETLMAELEDVGLSQPQIEKLLSGEIVQIRQDQAEMLFSALREIPE